MTSDPGAEVRALLAGRLGGTPYLTAMREVLERALDADQDEAVLLEEREGGRLRGIAVYGWVAGAERTGRLHLVVPAAGVPDADAVGAALCRRATTTLGQAGARLLVAELPDDPAVAWMIEIVRRAGWREEGRVPDYYRDGVALLLLRREMA